MSDSTHSGDRLIAPVPRITIQAFCETAGRRRPRSQAAADDRRMHKAHVKVQMGGAPAAVEAYRQAPTPNVIVLESHRRSRGAARPPRSLSPRSATPAPRSWSSATSTTSSSTASSCAAASANTSSRRSAVLDVVQAISDLFCAPGAEPVGRTIAVVGAKGGVGSSTVAHNLGWAIGAPALASRPSSPISTSPSAPPASTSTRTRRRASPRRSSRPSGSTPISSTGCCRSAATTSACSPRRRCSTAPPTSSRPRSTASSTSCAPRCPASSSTCRICGRRGSRRTLIGADEIVIVAAPELASLRNAKNLFDMPAPGPAERPQAEDRPQPGRRAEAARDRGGRVRQGARDRDRRRRCPSTPQLFGTAANNGQMIAEVQPAGQDRRSVRRARGARSPGAAEPKRAKANLLEPILARLARRKAS